jgi:mono/diheme cytochrome c family protein
MTARLQRSYSRSWSAPPICLVIRSFLPWILTLGLMAVSATGPAHAQGIGNPAEGKRIAASTCSSCHQIDVQLRDSTNDPVPSFQAIAAMPSTTMLSINVFLRTSHNVMPNIRLTEDQITDISAYILSLRDQSPK